MPLFQIIDDPKFSDGLLWVAEVGGLLIALLVIIALVMLRFAKPINRRLSR